MGLLVSPSIAFGPFAARWLMLCRMVAIILGFGSVLLFFFVPETFWDRQPTRHHRFHDEDSRSSLHFSRLSLSRPGSLFHHRGREAAKTLPTGDDGTTTPVDPEKLAQSRRGPGHVGFADDAKNPEIPTSPAAAVVAGSGTTSPKPAGMEGGDVLSSSTSLATHSEAWKVVPRGGAPQTPQLHNLNSPYYESKAKSGDDYFGQPPSSAPAEGATDETAQAQSQTLAEKPSESTAPPALQLALPPTKSSMKSPRGSALPSPSGRSPSATRRTAFSPTVSRQNSYFGEQPSRHATFSPQLSRASSFHGEHPVMAADDNNGPGEPPPGLPYTEHYRQAPAKSYVHTLRPFMGRLSQDNWFKVMLRPFILFAYPSVLWSTLTYSFSIGWLIVISESITAIYRSPETYNFSALQAGLIYVSPFIGGVLGTAVAGKISDIVVRYLSRKNDGVYEPEFRLVMAVPVAFTTCIGLMGFGWSAEERDAWIVPTVFFGIVSFGCSLGSTTAITFCVDSYRQYAGEALVTLNFSKSKSPQCWGPIDILTS
jgi:hypothetical protein